MLQHVAITVIFGLSLCGCSDLPQATTNDIAQPVTTREPSAVSNQTSTTTPTKTHIFTGARDVIVDGRLTVDVMEIAAPPRANELAQRLQKAASENLDWWLDYVKKANPGEPLPYDSRLGLSKAEYDEFLALSKKMTTQKKAQATLTVTTKDDNDYVFDGGQALPDFTGIEIDLKNDLVRTPFGVLTERSDINATEDSALGAWVGTQWKLEKPDPNGMTGTVVKLAVGRLGQSGRCVICYDVRKISLDGKTRISHVLNYDLPP